MGLVFIAQRRNSRRAQEKGPRGIRWQFQPARGQDPQDVAVREQSHIAVRM